MDSPVWQHTKPTSRKVVYLWDEETDELWIASDNFDFRIAKEIPCVRFSDDHLGNCYKITGHWTKRQHDPRPHPGSRERVPNTCPLPIYGLCASCECVVFNDDYLCPDCRLDLD